MVKLTYGLTIIFLLNSATLISFSIVWAVDIKGTVANDNIMGTSTDDDMRGFRGNDILTAPLPAQRRM